MSDTRDVSVTLTDDQMRKALVARDYASPAEIVREAMCDWQAKREAAEFDAAPLRNLWDAGKASGVPQPIDFDALRVEARRPGPKERD